MRNSSTPLLQLTFDRVNKLFNDIKDKRYSDYTELDVYVSPLNINRKEISEAINESFDLFKKGEVFAPAQMGDYGEYPWGQRWFKIDVPEAQKSEEGKRYLLWISHGETTVYINGTPWHGLDCCHNTCPLPDEECTLYLDCGLWHTGIWAGLPAPDKYGFRLFEAKLAIRNLEAWEASFDLEILVEWLNYNFEQESLQKPNTGYGYRDPIEEVSPVFRRMLKSCSDVCDSYDRYGLKALVSSLKILYEKFPAGLNEIKASYVGHAHIDLVWLWPEHVTYRKSIHTYATVLKLMEKYPDFTFTMSQPPLFYELKSREPEQAKSIQKRIQEGRWEFTGGLEVEADTQIPIGEGLVRSLIYGQERIENVRGQKSNTVWIPDVFGYSQCLPQLFSQAGIKNFYTTKLLWSAITKFPHNSFVWKSPDGSEVLTHLAVASYNCEVRVKEACDASREYRQSDVHDELLCAAGFGDGGGGPTEEHLERSFRMASLSNVPKSGWTTVESFFERLELNRNDLPTYRGELYLEYHRGVQTTQSDFKYNLRKCEQAFQTREAVRVIKGQSALGRKDWLRYLFAHFHDAIPGSSINSVYKDLNPELRNIWVNQFEKAKLEMEVNKSETCSVFNPLAFEREIMVELKVDGECAYTGETALPTQIQSDRALVCISQKGLQISKITWGKGKVENKIKVSKKVLSNGIVEANFDDNGQLYGLKIHGKDLLLEDPARLMLHTDNPSHFDAWDIDHQANWLNRSVAQDLQFEILESGPSRGVISAKSDLGKSSSIVVRYILEANSDVLKIELDVDWHEKHELLRYELQTSFRGQNARFGCPFGSIDRSQIEGHQSDEAKWEVPASRWAAVLDGRGFGLALITEAKYGFKVKDGCIGISLLRSPTSPDPVADQGRHHIVFALGAHSDITEGKILSTAAKAEALFTNALVFNGHAENNNPPITFKKLGSVVPSWVMPSQSDKGFLVRLHEIAGGSEIVSFRLLTRNKNIKIVDLLENPIEGNIFQNGEMFNLEVPPYKILTLHIS